MIHDAGWPIWLLVLTSLTGLALVFERLFALRTSRVLPHGLLEDVVDMVRRQQYSPEALERLAMQSPLGRVLAEVASVRTESAGYRQAAIEDVGKDVAFQLNRHVAALSTVAVIAPLLGLFGTVVGMIEIFASFTTAQADPGLLARGISVALYNTGLGILIAIPALIFHRYFRSRVNHFLHQLERQASTLNRIIGSRNEL